MKQKKLMKIGLAGAVLTVLCCSTPILVILLGAIGLGALTGYLDYILLPALLIFVGLTIYALLKQKKTDTCCIHPTLTSKDIDDR